VVVPGLQFQEKAAASRLIDTYGKTFHFWQVDRGDPLPFGEHSSPPLTTPVTQASFSHSGRLLLYPFGPPLVEFWSQKGSSGAG
jgi:hypothetical protein